MSKTPSVESLKRLLRESWAGPAWHGPALRESLTGVEAEQALARPPLVSHSIWELALHAAYWKHRVMCRVTGNPRGRFPRQPSNWPTVPPRPDPVRWLEDLALLDRLHADLDAALDTFDDRGLARRCGRYTVDASFRGVALHDVYHAGQIRLVRRMLERRA